MLMVSRGGRVGPSVGPQLWQSRHLQSAQMANIRSNGQTWLMREQPLAQVNINQSMGLKAMLQAGHEAGAVVGSPGCCRTRLGSIRLLHASM